VASLQSATVTVGLCVKDAEYIIKKALDSLIMQNFPTEDLDLIVVDGNSKDKTLQTIKDTLKNTRFQVRILKENRGLGFARQMVVQEG
jgi:glycosyltransferase involved in cell wall biosynthesis